LTFVGLVSPSAHALGFTGYSSTYRSPFGFPNKTFGKFSPTSVVFQGEEFVFFVGQDNNVYCGTYNGSVWYVYSPLSGVSTYTKSPVSAVVYAGKLWVFVTGTDGHIRYVTYDSQLHISDYTVVPNNGTTGYYLPAGVVQYNNLLYMFLTGTDSHISYQTYNATTGSWSGYTSVPNGGSTLTSVTPVVAGNYLDLFLVGTNGHPYLTIFNQTTWSGYSPVQPDNGVTYASVSAAFFENQVFLFLTGTNGHIYYNSTYDQSFNPNAPWTGYTEVPNGGVTSTNSSVGLTVFANPQTQTAPTLDMTFMDSGGNVFVTSGQ